MKPLWSLVLAPLAVGCASKALGPLEGADCEIAAIAPANGQGDVTLDFVVELTYTNDIDPSSLDDVSVTLQGGAALPVAVEAVGTRGIRLVPLRTPRFGSTYVVRTPGVEAAAGGSCELATSSFSTLTPSVVPRPRRAWGVESIAVAGTGDDAVALTTAATGRGLQVWSLASPASPHLVDEVLTPEAPVHVAVDGDRAYVAANDAGVLLLDVSQPDRPQRLGSFAAGDGVAQVVPFRRGATRYVALADRITGIRIFDVSEAASPQAVAVLDPVPGGETGVRRLAIAGDLLVAAVGTDGLALVSLADPAHPAVVQHVPHAGYQTFDVAAGAGWAWAALGYHGVRMYDVRDPAAPVLDRTIVGPNGPCTIACQDFFTSPTYRDGQLFLPTRYAGTHVFDVSPAGSGAALGPGRQWISDGFVFVAESHAGQVYLGGDLGLEVWNPVTNARVLSADASGGGWALGLSVSGDAQFAYLANGSRGLETFALDDPAQPVRIDRDGTPGTWAHADLPPFNTLVTANALVVADGRDRVVLFDVSQPDDPVQRGVIDGLDSTDALAMVDDVLYACAGNGGVRAIDIAQLSAPTSVALVGFAELGGRDLCLSLARAGDTLYVGTLTKLAMIDVADPRQPRWAGTFSLPGGEAFASLATSGQRLFAGIVQPGGDADARLVVLDTSAPRTPYVTHTSPDLGAIGDLLLVDDVAFVASGDRGIRIFDVGDVDAPVAAGIVPTPGRATHLVRLGEHVYVTQVAGGLDAVYIGPLPDLSR